jgi:hypothetical protein
MQPTWLHYSINRTKRWFSTWMGCIATFNNQCSSLQSSILQCNFIGQDLWRPFNSSCQGILLRSALPFCEKRLTCRMSWTFWWQHARDCCVTAATKTTNESLTRVYTTQEDKWLNYLFLHTTKDIETCTFILTIGSMRLTNGRNSELGRTTAHGTTYGSVLTSLQYLAEYISRRNPAHSNAHSVT